MPYGFLPSHEQASLLFIGLAQHVYKELKKAQSCSELCLPIVNKTRKFDHISPAMKELRWLPVREQLSYRDTVMTYKCINQMAPPYLCNKLFNRATIHSLNTRNCASLQIPLCTSHSGQRTFKYRAVKIWNSLEQSLKELKSLTKFKSTLKSKLLDNLYK